MFVRAVGGGSKMTPGVLLRLRATSRQFVLGATKTWVSLNVASLLLPQPQIWKPGTALMESLTQQVVVHFPSQWLPTSACATSAELEFPECSKKRPDLVKITLHPGLTLDVIWNVYKWIKFVHSPAPGQSVQNQLPGVPKYSKKKERGQFGCVSKFTFSNDCYGGWFEFLLVLFSNEFEGPRISIKNC